MVFANTCSATFANQVTNQITGETIENDTHINVHMQPLLLKPWNLKHKHIYKGDFQKGRIIKEHF